MRRLLAVITAVCVLTFPFVMLSGCGDDVKKVSTVERHHESPPEPVSPGEPIVE
ncbi:MAG: hypothetical protein V2A79_18695 [Planctomycetota bacterium]